MVKKILLTLVIAVVISLFNNNPVYAVEKDPGLSCNPTQDTCKKDAAGKSYSCQATSPGASIHQCLINPFGGTFGTIQPPDAIKGLLKGDPTGAGAISKLLTNIIGLFYAVAIIVLIFMILWGAYDWMTSEGDKEKLSSAQKKIINAMIGILLFAVAFAVIQVLGTFTGFKFFVGQK